MKIVKYNNKYEVLNSANRLAILHRPLTTLDCIFLDNHWKTLTSTTLDPSDFETIISDTKHPITSFKALKHHVAAHLLTNNIPSTIPTPYINSYNRNKKETS